MIAKVVKVVVDRPLGTHHPNHSDLIYSVNYGYIPTVFASDGEEQDAYILGVNKPVRILYPFHSPFTNKRYTIRGIPFIFHYRYDSNPMNCQRQFVVHTLR